MNSLKPACVVVVVFVLAIGGCYSPAPADGSLITCANNDECPAGFRCADSIGRCVNGDLDSDPPGVVDGSVVGPATALAPGRSFELAFSVDEALFGDPVVVCDAAVPLKLLRVDDDDDDDAYVYAADVASVHGEGTFVLNAQLVDLFGNAAEVALGTVSFDATAPVLTNSPADVIVVGAADASVSFEVTTSEPVSLPVVVVQGGRPATATDLGGGTRFSIAYDVGGDEAAAPVFALALQDIAGNDNVVELVPFLFDDDAPTIVDTNAPAIVGRGRRLVVELTADEALGSVAGAALVQGDVRVPLEAVRNGETRVILTLEVRPDTPEGDFDVVVDALADRAGNTAALTGLATVRVDRTLPARAGPAAPSPSRIAPAGSWSVGVDVDEDGVTLRELLVAGASVEADCAIVARSIACDVAGGATAALGFAPVALVVEDAAGNLAVLDAGALQIDGTGPRPVAATLLREPSLVRPGEDPVTTFSLTDPLTDGPVRVIVNLISEEPLSPTADVVVDAVAGDLPFSCQRTSAVSARCEHTIDADDPASSSLTATLTDDLGNVAADQDLGLLVVIERDAPDVDEALIVLERAPWGRLGDAFPAPRLSVRAPAGTTDATEILVLAGDGPVGAVLLARGAVQADGGFVVDVAGGDRPVVFVAGVSEGGVRGPALAVRQVAWTATMGGKRVGSDVENPHIFEARGAFTGSVLVESNTEIDAAQTLGADGDVVVTRSLPSWRGLATPQRPYEGEVSDFTLAYDARRGVTVGFDVDNQKMWEASAGDFSPLPIIDPEGDGLPSRIGLQLGFNGALGRVVALDQSARLYAWDGRSWALLPAGGVDVVGARDQGVASAPNGGTLFFGGCPFNGCSGTLDRALVFDGAAFVDVAVGVAGVDRPAPRNNTAVVHDPDRDVTLISGGSFFAEGAGTCPPGGALASGSCRFNDTWEFDGDGFTRTGDLPQAVFAAVGGYDARTREALLTVGDQTFSYANGSWRERAKIRTRLRPRFADAIVSDARRGVAVAHALIDDGGGSFSRFGLFRWDGDDWVLESGRTVNTATLIAQPDDRFETASATDVDGRAFFLHGMPRSTSTCGPELACADQWSFDGAAYLQSLAVTPPGRMSAGIALDDDRGLNVMFGGVDIDNGFTAMGDTWEWNGAAWTQRCLSDCTPPSPRGHPYFAFLPGVGAVMMGGETQFFQADVDETWIWNGLTWRQCLSASCTTGGPTARSDGAMAYDAVSDRIIAFGGTTAEGLRVAETWAFDGFNWTLVDDGAAGPPARSSAKLVAHPGLGLVLIGGILPFDPGNTDTWVWDGASWSILETADPEGDGDFFGGQWPAAAFDEVEGGTVVFSGAASPRGQSRILDSHDDDRPAHVLRARFSAAGAPADVVIDDLELQWTAGGSAGSGDGVSLAAWNGVSFVPLTLQEPHTAPSSSPAPLLFSTDGEPRLDTALERARFLTGATRDLAFVATAGPGGTLTSDAVAVTVRYTLP